MMMMTIDVNDPGVGHIDDDGIDNDGSGVECDDEGYPDFVDNNDKSGVI